MNASQLSLLDAPEVRFALAQVQPRYRAYMQAHGHNDPEVQLAADRERWPGGLMAGFQLWMSTQWALWRQETGNVGNRVLSSDDHRRFDAWLREVSWL